MFFPLWNLWHKFISILFSVVHKRWLWNLDYQIWFLSNRGVVILAALKIHDAVLPMSRWILNQKSRNSVKTRTKSIINSKNYLFSNHSLDKMKIISRKYKPKDKYKNKSSVEDSQADTYSQVHIHLNSQMEISLYSHIILT